MYSRFNYNEEIISGKYKEKNAGSDTELRKVEDGTCKFLDELGNFLFEKFAASSGPTSYSRLRISVAQRDP